MPAAPSNDYVVFVSNTAGVTNSSLAALALFGARRAISNAELRIYGPTNRAYRVDYANALSNLQTWSFLTNVSLATNFGIIAEPTAPARTLRFYRPVLLP